MAKAQPSSFLPRRETLALIFSLASVAIAALSYRVAKYGLELTELRDQTAAEAEARRNRLYLYGRPTETASGMDLLTLDPSVLIQRRFVRLEYGEKNVDAIALAPNSTTLEMA